MNSLSLAGEKAAVKTSDSDGFNSKSWLNYFIKNKETQSSICIPETIVLDQALTEPLLRSLSRFQIGETGDGRHLRRYARGIGDPVYFAAVDLFIKEEQLHGQILAQIIIALDGKLLSWHWSDLAFIILRRMLGLKTEIFIILIAEIIGKCFYRLVSDRIENQILSNAFAIIVCDEIAHLRFHCEFLKKQLHSYPGLLQMILETGWYLLFQAACLVFVFDHRKTLKALGSNQKEFIEL